MSPKDPIIEANLRIIFHFTKFTPYFYKKI